MNFQLFDLASSVELLVFVTVLFMTIFAIDDFFIDVLSWFTRSRPQSLTPSFLDRLDELPQSKIAILIANWKEADVIERMIQGNLAGIDYQNYQFFLGVYPNDVETRDLAVDLSHRYPQVFAVINSRSGPTSKGQMLNECVRAVFQEELNSGTLFDVFLMHDSEDVIHPRSLKLMNYYLAESDFVQIPVYSFNLPIADLIGATYLDEFSEHHSKEMIVRSKLNQAVPSAGTGTAMSRDLILSLREAQGGSVFNEATLTEDYHLGHLSHKLGFRTQFLCSYIERDQVTRDFIATREYFPKSFKASVRQKTRWCIGIYFQGEKNLGWDGSTLHKYFLWRDRRGLLNSVLLTMSIGTLFLYSLTRVGLSEPLGIESHWFFKALVLLNALNLCFRIFRRSQSVLFINSLPNALMTPVRWPIANVINLLATYRAWREFRIAEAKGESPRWVKTQHELPAEFGVVVPRAPTLKPTWRPVSERRVDSI